MAPPAPHKFMKSTSSMVVSQNSPRPSPKKKTELKIESFFELDDYLVKLYAEIILLNDVARKTLVFNARLN